MPSAIVLDRFRLDDSSRIERAHERRSALRHHADDAHVGFSGFHHCGEARYEAAAADGDEDGAQVGHFFEYLDAQRALARDDVGVIERRDHREAAFFLVGASTRIGVIEGCAEQFRLCAQGTHGVELGVRRGFGHHDQGPDAQLLGREGHALGMVPRARGDDAPLKLRGVEFLQRIQGAAHLERTRSLEILRLEIHLDTQLLGEILAETGGGRPQMSRYRLRRPRRLGGDERWFQRFW